MNQTSTAYFFQFCHKYVLTVSTDISIVVAGKLKFAKKSNIRQIFVYLLLYPYIFVLQMNGDFLTKKPLK